MLDGNAALAGLNEQRFKRLQTADSPVIVTIAYDTEAYFDVNARAYDYTPPLSNGTPEEIKKHGGADIFWQFIEYKVKPLVAQTAALDLQRQAVWGTLSAVCLCCIPYLITQKVFKPTLQQTLHCGGSRV